MNMNGETNVKMYLSRIDELAKHHCVFRGEISYMYDDAAFVNIYISDFV